MQSQLPNSDIIHGFLWACNRNEWKALLIVPGLHDIFAIGEKKQHSFMKKGRAFTNWNMGRCH